MQLNHEQPDYIYSLRAADGHTATVNHQVLRESFILAPNTLLTEWRVDSVQLFDLNALQPLLALEPELVLIGTGARQEFPSAEVVAACLSRGVGIEVMTNAATARTFHILASEGRRVVAGFILSASA